ncbi:MAG: diphosphate--fructose-6-phosphate 1-phosphotransferase [Deltaproteobacteria bacterium CG_4_10_14_3_um_filter_51_14]|nr:ATP-dependent 6-phosphofructokinase [bacterium]PIY24015.1 MAG: diphosphate--fructose-6-phosphate 1-phosphotransferase [Deltaproteobacteria bacterium CG_4_10_14_3_um_filter_51_14]PJB35872.1 MAG: diphosphate--fructose-6-phosphate 1-phosphotransferase [Deltaproteobacteria bacterium CG_4_9_14_3_um_filter_51_14]
MTDQHPDFPIEKLGDCKIPSPMSRVLFTSDDDRVVYDSRLSVIKTYTCEGENPPAFEMAGPREKIFFDPSKLKCGIVTCGGICPGVNDVIRAITLSLFHHYGVRAVFGFRYGFEGLSPKYQHPVLELTPSDVAPIHQIGGTILGTSRGPQDVEEMVDTLERMNVSILFAVGGDGTLRGAQAIGEEISKRRLKMGVIGVPKTIDNDISFVGKSFGFETAVAESKTATYSAHVEAVGARNGIGLVKLMGREAGFIAAHASLANPEVNFCLIPEVRFSMDVFLDVLKARLQKRGHAVIVIAEGAGQDIMGERKDVDPSGNPRLGDIGSYMRDMIKKYLDKQGTDFTLKYIDPSYTIRSMPANPQDSVFCLLLGHNAVHAGMAGRTNMVVGHWNGEYTHVPICTVVSRKKRVDPRGRLWSSVIASTGQPAEMI